MVPTALRLAVSEAVGVEIVALAVNLVQLKTEQNQ
jgi:Tfp pilus assembly PilM family ATPase